MNENIDQQYIAVGCLPSFVGRAFFSTASRSALRTCVLQDYDVYVAEKQPLPAGEEKHVISVFVADEAGLINRVAGVFARRGACSSRAAAGASATTAVGQWQLCSSCSSIAASRQCIWTACSLQRFHPESCEPE